MLVVHMPINIPSGNDKQFATLKMAVEIVGLPINSMVMFHVYFCKRVPEGNSLVAKYMGNNNSWS